jgi:hypothetical protein
VTASPTWTILVATIGRRRQLFTRLVGELTRQARPHAGRVKIIALWNNGERPLGHVRQALIESATTDYVSFVDDDDQLPEYHVDEVLTALGDGDVDYVGWRMQCYIDGVKMKPTFHSLRYKNWYEDETGYYRDVSHLNPVRRSLALRCDFARTEPPEDVAWVNQLRPHVKTERYVDRVMYHYFSSPGDSTWRPGSVQAKNFRRVEVSDVNFTYHPWSFTIDALGTYA